MSPRQLAIATRHNGGVTIGDAHRPGIHLAALCPCGAGNPYAACCAPLHRAEATAATAQALMRSRFSAFALGDVGYLLRTWHHTTRPRRLTLDPAQRWTRLDILSTQGGGVFDRTGTVEFRARYALHGRTGTLHEHSQFVRNDTQWNYLNPLPPTPALGRNS